MMYHKLSFYRIFQSNTHYAPLSLTLSYHQDNGIHYLLTQTQRIHNNVGFTEVVKDTHVIVLQKFQPYSLSEIQLFLSEHILKAFVFVNTSTWIQKINSSIFSNQTLRPLFKEHEHDSSCNNRKIYILSDTSCVKNDYDQTMFNTV